MRTSETEESSGNTAAETLTKT